MVDLTHRTLLRSQMLFWWQLSQLLGNVTIINLTQDSSQIFALKVQTPYWQITMRELVHSFSLHNNRNSISSFIIFKNQITKEAIPVNLASIEIRFTLNRVLKFAYLHVTKSLLMDSSKGWHLWQNFPVVVLRKKKKKKKKEQMKR